MKAILAMSKNRCIGKDGKLPWHHKEDFQWFKEFTMGKTLVVGRKTFDDLPILKGRKCIGITKGTEISRAMNSIIFKANKNGYDGALVPPHYVLDINAYYPDTVNSEYVIAGGKSIYELFMPHITEFYVTHIDKEYDGDTFMEPFEHLFSKNEVVKEFDFGRVIRYEK